MKETLAQTWRFADLPLEQVDAHGGLGVRACRLAEPGDVASRIHFMDYVEIEPGGTIGRHRHAVDGEEYYLVLAGRGRMFLDGEEAYVSAGDLVRNNPGGEHGLTNTGGEFMKLFVFEVEVTGHETGTR